MSAALELSGATLPPPFVLESGSAATTGPLLRNSTVHAAVLHVRDGRQSLMGSESFSASLSGKLACEKLAVNQASP